MKNHLLSSVRRPSICSTTIAAALAACLLTPKPAHADVIAVWDGSTAAWSNPAHWSSNPDFPNNGGGNLYHAIVQSGVVTVNGDFEVTSLFFNGGTITGDFALRPAASVDFEGGSFGDGMGTGKTYGVVNIDFSSIGSGSIEQNYTLENAALEFSDPGTWTGTGTFFNNGTFLNSAAFDIQNDQTMANNGHLGTLTNNSTITKTVATGTTTIQSFFNNAGGMIDVQTGIVSLTGGGAGTGNAKFGGSGSGVVSFDNGVFDMDGGTSFVGTGVSRVAGATVNINGPATASNFTVVVGTLGGNGTLTVSGALNFNGGGFGDGTATGATSGALVVDFSSTGSGAINNHYTLTNNGAGAWTGTGTFFNNGTLSNSGNFNIQNDQSIVNNGNIGIFNNTGTLTKTVATGTTTIQSIFNNTGGTVSAQTGTISFTSGGAATSNAIFSSTDSGVISFDNGTFDMAGGTSFTGTGVSRLTSGTVNINGPATATQFTVIGGTLAGAGTLTASGALNFNGGSFGDGTGAGMASGPLLVDFSSTGGGAISNHYTLINSGIGVWTGTGTFFNNGTLVNSGIFNIVSDQNIINNGNLGTFNNTGTLYKITTPGATTIQSVFNNTGGTVSVSSGTVRLTGGGSATGNATFSNTGSGVTTFDGGAFDMAGGTSFVGTGVSRVDGATVNINGPVTASLFNLNSGTVAGNGTLASGALSFTGGAFGDGTATGTTTGPLAVDFSATGSGTINNLYTLTNNGAGTWTGTGTFFNNGTLSNSGNFNIQNDQNIINNGNLGIFNNSGTLTKTVATGATTIQSTFNNTGTVDVQSGTVSLTGSVTNFNGGTNTLTGGTWKATGAASTLSIDSAGGDRAITTLVGGADVTVGNATATITGLAVSVINSGSALRSTGGATVTSGGALTSFGTVEAGTGSTLDVKSGGAPALFTQDSGHLLLTGGTVTASAFTIAGGEIEGSGSLNGGDVTASGSTLLSPGQSIGRIDIGDNYSQTGGTGAFELGRSGGLPVADLLAAQGDAAFSNVTFTLSIAPGSAPLLLGDTFTIFEADSDQAGGGALTMSNDTFLTDASLTGYTLAPVQTATTYGFTVTAAPAVPEPSSAFLAVTGLLGLAGLRRPRPARR